MKLNKKGFFPGWEYIAGFFLIAIVFVFIVGMYDFTIVEVYEPMHVILNDSLVQLNANDSNSLAYQGFINNYDNVHNKTLPFNLLFIFVFAVAVMISFINVSKQKKLEPMELMFKTVGGMIFFLYLMQVIIFKVIDYFKLEVIDYLFEDLIISYLPFYQVIMDNAGPIILIWGGSLVLFNWYFGTKASESKGVFG